MDRLQEDELEEEEEASPVDEGPWVEGFEGSG